jgi:hypothetical protein
MKEKLDALKPGVPNSYLVLFAGIMWFFVGIFLSKLAISWLNKFEGSMMIYIVVSVFFALIIHHFGFLKIAAKNLIRINKLEGLRCAFSFIEWKSYLLILVMISFGIILRHSGIPKQYLAIIYLSIGLALAFSSLRYFIYIIKKRKISLDS